jgi:hypothetical protein
MSRITVIASLSILFFASSGAYAESCGDRVKAFDTYEDYDDKMNKEEGVSIYSVMDFSPHSSFQGLLVQAKENAKTKVEIEVLKDGGSLRKKSWEFSPWKLRSGYLATKDIEAYDFMGNEEAQFILRLTLNGKVLCEDSPKDIYPGD